MQGVMSPTLMASLLTCLPKRATKSCSTTTNGIPNTARHARRSQSYFLATVHRQCSKQSCSADACSVSHDDELHFHTNRAPISVAGCIE